jgi:uncharacterized protein YraI
MKHYRLAFLFLIVAGLAGVFAWTADSADAGWEAAYWNNRHLGGTPVLTRTEPGMHINHDWGTGSPAPGVVTTDHFSVRWTRHVDLEPGRYRFTMTTDDGGRLWVNNRMIINEWWSRPARAFSAEIDLHGGPVPIRFEMYEEEHLAVAKLSWERIGDVRPAPTHTPVRPAPTATPAPTRPPASGGACHGPWQANYWNNTTLSGAPALVRQDGTINFQWGDGSPAPGTINVDHFSARWVAIFQLPRGSYYFTGTSDDGMRVWVNDRMVLEQWYDHGPRTMGADYFHEGGSLSIRVEYYDRIGNATIQFSCFRVGDNPIAPAPTATPVTPPPTPTPTRDPAEYADAGACVISRVGVLNVRERPSLTAPIITQVYQGERTTFTGNRSGSWVQIRTQAGKIGWINGYYCGSGEAPRTDSGTATATTALNIRSGPGVHHTVIGLMQNGQTLSLYGTRTADNQWVSVYMPNGSVGWVSARYVNLSVSITSLRVV